ncbi:MAG: DNA polymerase III subunit beta [Oscillospiraceae bacterium]|nr:DNA polymerase III subunit beta [Oscillospiraceae bacterium]
MKFTCDKQSLYDAVAHVSKGIAQRSTISALEGIKVRLSPDNLELTGYDLEFGIQKNLEVQTEDSGEFVLNAFLLREAVRRFSGQEVSIEIDDNLNVSMYCEATEFHISGMSAEEYPALPDMNMSEGMHIEQAVLKTMINQTSYATSMNETKPVLTGELFEIRENQLSVVAIDGYRLAIRNENVTAQEPMHFVVPKRTVTEVANMLKEDAEQPCIVSVSRSHILFEFEGYIVFSRLLEGEFHNYRSSIPAAFETEVVVKTSDLVRCLERCSLLINSKFNAPIRCLFSCGSLNVRCKTGIGEINDTIPVQLSGPDVKIGLNNRFMLEAIRATDCDQVKIQMTGGNRVVKIVPMQGESFIFLLMPIQIKG